VALLFAAIVGALLVILIGAARILQLRAACVVLAACNRRKHH